MKIFINGQEFEVESVQIELRQLDLPELPIPELSAGTASITGKIELSEESRKLFAEMAAEFDQQHRINRHFNN